MLLIKNGTIHLPDGKTLQNHDILTEGKKIKSIGPNITASELPGDKVQEIDASGKEVFPGFVLAVSCIGAHGFTEKTFDDSEIPSPMNPHLDIVYSLDIREVTRQRFTRTGITSYGLSPGAVCPVEGQMAVINVHGKKTEDLILIRKAAMKANYTGMVKATFGEKEPRTRMAMYAMMDEAFRAAKEYMGKEEKDYDAKHEAMGKVLSREIPFFANAFAPHEIGGMMKLAKKWGFRLVINGAFGIETHAEEAIREGHHVVLGDMTYLFDAIRHGADAKNLVALYRAGLKLSLATSNDTAYPAGFEQILWQAALMHRAGAKPYEIIDMMTINPARALGADHLVGSIEVGKHADIIICDGNPVARYDAKVLQTIVAGEVCYDREGK